MLKELIARVIQPTTIPVPTESLDPDDIHEKIRKGVEKFLSDAGYSNLTVVVGPQGGCSHEKCVIESKAYFSNVRIDTATELCETFHVCAKNAFIIIASEILGKRELRNESYTMEFTD